MLALPAPPEGLLGLPRLLLPTGQERAGSLGPFLGQTWEDPHSLPLGPLVLEDEVGGHRFGRLGITGW